MLSVNLRNKQFIKRIFADSSGSLLKFELFTGCILLRNDKTRIVECFSSLVKADASVVSSRTEKLEKKKSYTVSYLVNSCGLSSEIAAAASEKVRFGNSRKPDSVIAQLEKLGFSKPEIATIVRKKPFILLHNVKNLSPKVEFFQSIGIPKADVARLISGSPNVLSRSLKDRIIPNYNIFKSVLVTDEKVAAVMKKNSWAFIVDGEKTLAPNLAILKDLNVSESKIKCLLTHFPEAVMQSTGEFKGSVSKVLEMGFHPLKSVFVLALHAVSGQTNKVTWDRCYEIYSSWGWSKDDIYAAFKKHPGCMLISQKKITRTMDFLVNNMGRDSKFMARNPTVLLFSLEKRIIPRCSVIQLLLSRGLISVQWKLNSVLKPSEDCFLKRYVFKYEKEIPDLHDFYKQKSTLEN